MVAGDFLQDPQVRQWLDGVELIWTPLTCRQFAGRAVVRNNLLLRARTHDGRDGQGIGSLPGRRPVRGKAQPKPYSAPRAAGHRAPGKPRRCQAATRRAGRAKLNLRRPLPE